MGKFKEKFNEFKNNPDVALKEQVGYVSGVFGNCMGQDSVSSKKLGGILCSYMFYPKKLLCSEQLFCP